MGRNDIVCNHVLVIRLSAMGDVAMTVPVLKKVLDTYPKARITVLTKSFFRPLFSQLPRVEVYVADTKGRHNGLFGLWKLYRELKTLQIDRVVDLHNVVRSNILKIYFGLGGTPFFQINKGRAERKGLTSFKNKILKPLKTTHQRYADVFSGAGLPFGSDALSLLTKEDLTDPILDIVGDKEGIWLGIAPFAAFPGKMYPLSLMEEVIAELNNTNKYKILLFGGGQKESDQLDKIAQKYPNCINTAGKLSFGEELVLISNLDLMLSMDSGNGHLAANYGVPVLTIWGVTHPYAGFYPYGQDPKNALLADRNEFPFIPTSIYGNKMPPGYEKAIETVRPQDVVNKIVGLLEEKRAN